MTIEDHSTSELQETSVQTNKSFKYIISGLILLTVAINLSLYNIILVRDYNSEISCISQGNKQCVIGNFPCTEYGITYRNFNELNFQQIEFNLIFITDAIVLTVAGFMIIRWLLKKDLINTDPQKRYRLNVFLVLMAVTILVNMLFYNTVIMRADYVLEMQDIGCYTLLNPTVFSQLIIDNFINNVLAIVGFVNIIISFVGINYIIHEQSTNHTQNIQ